MGAARRIGVSAALTLIALTVTLGALAAPASAMAVGGQSAEVAAATVAAPRGPTAGGPGGMDLMMLAAVAGPIVALGVLAACRPRLVRRRLIRRFRAEIRDCDLVRLWP